MTTTFTNAGQPASALEEAENSHRMQCMELWGGISETRTSVAMTGLDGYVFSRPYNEGTHGGDVYYFTSCASGRISRILLADVTGHGAAVAQTAEMLRTIMRRKVNVIGQTSLMSAINTEFGDAEADDNFATAVVMTYFAPTRSLTLSAAGHPPPLVYHASSERWCAFGETQPSGMEAGLPLGIAATHDYPPQTVSFQPGDRLLAYTDAFFEARDGNGDQLQTQGLLELMNRAPAGSLREQVAWLVNELENLAPENLREDDATAVLIEPTGQKIPMKNNLLAPLKMICGVREVHSSGQSE